MPANTVRIMRPAGEVLGPDGTLYLATDNAEGRILKLVPKS